MGLTATWAITTEAERFLGVVRGLASPFSPWRVTGDLGEVRPPWTVLEAFVTDFDASSDVLDEWVGGGGSPLLLVGVFDSDGADLGIAGSTPARAFIGLEGYASSLFPGWAPFDDDGNMLEGEALEELQAASDAEFSRVCEHLRSRSLVTSDAAAALHRWAQDAGVVAAPEVDLAAVLERDDVFAEDSVRHLVDALGLRGR
jgi:hypothetical protein